MKFPDIHDPNPLGEQLDMAYRDVSRFEDSVEQSDPRQRKIDWLLNGYRAPMAVIPIEHEGVLAGPDDTYTMGNLDARWKSYNKPVHSNVDQPWRVNARRGGLRLVAHDGHRLLTIGGVGVFPIFGGTVSIGGPEANGHIAPHHLQMLEASGIPPEHAHARGYETITESRRLVPLKIVKSARSCVPGLLVPMLRADGSTWGYQYRPDNPRVSGKGQPVKYETPWQQRNGLDIPPGVGDFLHDPSVPLWVTEGVKKADCGAQYQLCIVALSGVWNWRGTNDMGGKTAIADWNDIALNDRRVILAFDGDVARKPNAAKALCALAEFLKYRGAEIEYLHLPDTEKKTGLDDYLMAGHTADDLWKLVKPTPPPVPDEHDDDDNGQPAEPKPEPAEPISLAEAQTVFCKWLGSDYDTDALDAMLAAAAVEKFDDGSDPVWLLLVSGPGAAKTETAQALDGIGATVTSAISSDAALLSGTPIHERAKGATGGLLRKIGERGVLVIKDVTSILSMDRNLRGKVLAALREVYDGRWTREVGAGGGATLGWRGRIAVVGAVTTAWDTAHAVISMMGDRFVLLRMDSTIHRLAAGRKAIGNTGDEAQMRGELAKAAAGVIAGMDTEPITVTEAETGVLLAAADLVTLARTGVEYDYRGDVIDAHAPEMPTRFAKQLAQIVRGAVAIGMDRADALRLAIRCARDSMPPLRLAIIDDLAAHLGSTTSDVRKRIDKPHTTVDRQLQALHMLGVVTCEEMDIADSGDDRRDGRSRWFYSLAEGIDPDTLKPESVTRNVSN
jgi:hypothetical protein